MSNQKGYKKQLDGSFKVCDDEDCCPQVTPIDGGTSFRVTDDDGGSVVLTRKQLSIAGLIADLEKVTPVDQTLFGKPHGNCTAACVASILGVSIGEIPVLSGEDWMAVLNGYLRPFGLGAVNFTWEERSADWLPKGTYHLFAGPSPRGDWWHSVVGLDGQIAHDPHPSRAGLAGTEREITLFVFLGALG